MEMDMSVYLGAFLDEVDEQLQILDEEVLNLEQDAENIETIQRIFRAAHTLKGSSAAMGMDKMKELTHKVENIFDLIRNGQLKVNTNIINIIFQAIDLIKDLKESILQGIPDSMDISEFIQKLEDLYQRGNQEIDAPKTQEEDFTPTTEHTEFPPVVLDEYQKGLVFKAEELGMNTVAVHVSLYNKAQLKSVRAFLIHNNLKEIGEIIASFPLPEVIEDEEQFDGKLVFIVITDSTNQEVFKIINTISDIQAIHLTSITSKNLHEFAEGKKLAVTEKSVHDQSTTLPKADTRVKVQQTVRVDVERLENLLNLVGELVIGQTRFTDFQAKLADRYPDDSEIEGFQEVINNFGHVVSELQEGMMKTRMLPIEQLFNRFPRMVRDTAQKMEKEVQFLIEGKETELDRNIIEEIADPIIHLLRNSIDHGIESPEEREKVGKSRQGTILLKASHEENHIVITISDDGKGIDVNKVRESALKKGLTTLDELEAMTKKDIILLIFKSGVSTTANITDVSGRGVGMDIVRSHIEKLNGMIDIDTEVGQGTTFTIKLPLTLAIIRSLTVQLGEKQFAIPLANVQEIIRLDRKEIKTIQNKEVGIVRDRVLPLVRMHDRLNASTEELQKRNRVFVVVVGLAEKRVGLVIDRTLGNQEVVIKPLGKYIGTPKYISGATIMGDGKVALILDVGSIVLEEGTTDVVQSNLESNRSYSEKTLQLTTFQLGDEEYGLEISGIKDIITVPPIQRMINSPHSVLGMINLRGNIIPVMDLRQRLNISQRELTKKSRVIVVEFHDELIGLLVDGVNQVMKVSEETLESAPGQNSLIESKFISGISHIDDRIIIQLNIHSILEIEELIHLKQYINNKEVSL